MRSNFSLRTRRGFTIVEMLLSMAFVGGLLVLISILTMRVTSMYQRGLSMKSINSVGRHLIDDISYSIKSSPTKPAEMICREYLSGAAKDKFDACVKDGASKYNFYQAYGKLAKIDGKQPHDDRAVPLYGTFCTGRYSYLWNSGYLLNTEKYTLESPIDPAKLSSAGRDYQGRLLRFLDAKRELCASNVSNNYDYQIPASQNYQLKTALNSPPVDLISETDESLAVYDLRLFRPAIHSLTRQVYHSGTFILATMRGGVDITGLGDYCVNPSDTLATDFSYCAINKFNFAVRATGELTIDEQAERDLRYEKKK